MDSQSGAALDAESLELLEDGLRKTMLSTSGAELDTALAELGWADMLSDMSDVAIPLVFRLLGETGSHASVLNDVMLETIGGLPGGTPPLPYAGGWVVWERDNSEASANTLGGLPLRRVPEGEAMRLSEARRALGWWLVGSARAMLALARQHALDRVQFGRPIASFQAVRHRLAETLVAIEGAEATLSLPGAGNVDLTVTAGQGRRGQGRADRGPTLPAGPRRHRLHRRARPAPSREAGAGARRIARQLKRTHPQGRRGTAGPWLGTTSDRPLSSELGTRDATARVQTKSLPPSTFTVAPVT